MSTRRQLSDVLTLTFRNLLHIRREPLRLSDATIQPVLFTLLFVYVFGAAAVLPGGGSLQAVRDRRPALDEPDHRLHRDRRRHVQRPPERRDRPLPHATAMARKRPDRTHTRRPPHGRYLRRLRRRHRRRDRLGAARERALGDRSVRALPRVRLRALLDLHLSRDDQRRCRVRPGDRSDRALPARDRLQTRSSPPRACRSSCARSQTGTPSAPLQPRHASCSATQTRQPASTPGRCNTRSPPP